MLFYSSLGKGLSEFLCIHHSTSCFTRTYMCFTPPGSVSGCVSRAILHLAIFVDICRMSPEWNNGLWAGHRSPAICVIQRGLQSAGYWWFTFLAIRDTLLHPTVRQVRGPEARFVLPRAEKQRPETARCKSHQRLTFSLLGGLYPCDNNCPLLFELPFV